MKLATLVSVTVMSCAVSMGTQASDIAAGKAKAAMCAACHGAAGVSTNPLWPNLAGQKAAYLKKQLNDFKSGARKDPTMSSMAMPLSPADIDNLAAYYASL